jgi:hypothetical protein
MAPAIAATVGAGLIGQMALDAGQTDALEALQEAYINNGGNIVEAANSLTSLQSNLISSLDYTDTQLEELCQAAMANTQAIIENNKEIVNLRFENNKEYN